MACFTSPVFPFAPPMPAGNRKNDIGALWQTFLEKNISEQIPGKTGNAVYCVYTDYENGAAGAYTTLLGCAVLSLKNLPETLVGITVPAATYQVYISTGALPQSVLNTWTYIWQTSIDRAYKTDFDVYGTRADAEVETWLSVL